ncbi:MAG: hypothetical protein ABIJ08_05985 [Nanoarchaeota archaeon]
MKKKEVNKPIKSFIVLVVTIILASVVVYVNFLSELPLDLIFTYLAIGFVLLDLIILIQKLFSRKKKNIEKSEKKEKKKEVKKVLVKKADNVKHIETKIRLKMSMFIIFLLSIIGFVAGTFLKNDNIVGVSLFFMFIALIFYRFGRTRHKVKIKKEKVELENKVTISEISKKKPISDKIPVKELPKGLKIELKGHETDMDVLYKIVEQRGKIKISTLTDHFNMDRKKIEELATILEDHELARIYYPAVGEPEVRKWQK